MVMNARIWALCLVPVLAMFAGCNKGGGDKGDSDSSGEEKKDGEGGAGGEQQVDGTKAGVTETAGDEVVVAGQLALTGLGLTAGTPNKVIAIEVAAGQVKGIDKTMIVPVNADGTFNLKLVKKPRILKAIEESAVGDGTYDRAKLEAAIGEPLPSGVSDAEITQYAEEMKAEMAKGGLSYVIVAFDDTLPSLRAQAESFQFIGLSDGTNFLNGLPLKSAKGNISLGKVTNSGGDQAAGELKLDNTVFDLSGDALAEMARLGAMLKSVRNVWINEERVRTMPFFNHNAPMPVDGEFTDVAEAAYNGWGMYISVDVPDVTFDAICSKSNEGKLTLAPPKEIDLSGTYMGGKVGPDRPFDNGGLTEIKKEGSRYNCGGTDTGFYGAGTPEGQKADAEDAGNPGVMINWGTGGMAGLIPDGYWNMKWKDQSIGEFELGSAGIFAADGHPVVYLPSVKVTKDAKGLVTKVEVELYKPDGDNWVKVTDPTAFINAVSGFNVEFNDDKEDGSRFDNRYSLLGKNTGGLFTISAADFVGYGSDKADSWKGAGTSATADYEVDGIAVYYEMYGSSYRVSYRDSTSNNGGDTQQGE